MMQMAETLLVKCLKSTIDLETFDVLHLAAFNGNAPEMDSERTSFTSVNTKHTKSIFSITVVGTSPVQKSPLEMNTESFGFVRKGHSIVPANVPTRIDVAAG